MERNAKFKDVGLSYFLSLMLMFAVSVVLSGVLTAVCNITSIDINDLSSQNWVLYLNLFLSEFIFVIAFFIIVFIRKDKNFTSTYKLKFKFDFKLTLILIILGVFSVLSCVNITNLFNLGFSYISPAIYTNSLGIKIDSFSTFLLCELLLVVLPSVCEELVFRGIIYNGLRQRYNVKVSVLISAFMFMLIHMSIYKTFYQLILGVILALLVYYTGSIFYGVIFHFANNFFIVLSNYIGGEKSIFEFAYFGAKEIVLSILIFLVGVFVFVLFFKFLKEYTRNKGDCFNLETTKNPLDESFKNNAKFEELSYEEKVAFNNKSNEGLGLFLISFLFVLIMWCFNSFGGFI